MQPSFYKDFWKTEKLIDFTEKKHSSQDIYRLGYTEILDFLRESPETIKPTQIWTLSSSSEIQRTSSQLQDAEVFNICIFNGEKTLRLHIVSFISHISTCIFFEESEDQIQWRGLPS